MSDDVRVGVFGLGEAGSLIAGDLSAAGASVVGFDPAPVPSPPGVERTDDPGAVATRSSVILSITAAVDSETALTQALDSVEPGSLYADLATGSAELKRRLAEIAGENRLEFVDVALLSTVPGRGVSTPSLASGPGSQRYAAVINRLGGRCEDIGGHPGDAATRKLLRSVVMKGLAGLMIEAMRAARATGQEGWLWADLVSEITQADEILLTRLVTGTGVHAARRLHEMEAATDLLQDLGVEPVMTRATVDSLRETARRGVPAIPADGD